MRNERSALRVGPQSARWQRGGSTRAHAPHSGSSGSPRAEGCFFRQDSLCVSNEGVSSEDEAASTIYKMRLTDMLPNAEALRATRSTTTHHCSRNDYSSTPNPPNVSTKDVPHNFRHHSSGQVGQDAAPS